MAVPLAEHPRGPWEAGWYDRRGEGADALLQTRVTGLCLTTLTEATGSAAESNRISKTNQD